MAWIVTSSYTAPRGHSWRVAAASIQSGYSLVTDAQSRRSITQAGKVRAGAPRSATPRSSGDRAPRGFNPYGYMTSSTPLVIGSGQPALGLRIARYYLVTSQITSQRTTLHPKSALWSPLRSECASWGHAKVTHCL